MLEGARKEYLDGTRRHGCVRFPVEKFLRSRLGQLWNDVYAELSKEFDRRTYAGYRFWRDFSWHSYWSHQTVATGCWIGAETGTIYNNIDKRVEGFYVHPFTGLLCYQGPKIKPPLPSQSIDRIIIEHNNITPPEKHYPWKNGTFCGTAYEKIEGIWYYTEYKQNDCYYRYPTYPNFYQPDKPYSTTHRRQLNKKELRRLNVTNNTHDEIVGIKKEIANKEAERRTREKEWMEKTNGSH